MNWVILEVQAACPSFGIAAEPLHKESESPDMLQNIIALAPEETAKRCLDWMAFMENDVEFWPFGGLVHQKNHWARVLVLAMTIGASEGFSPADLDALAMAAAFHDTRRKDAWLDTGHGFRAAEHYHACCESLGLEFDPRTYLAIQWHDQDDIEGLARVSAWDAENGLRDGWNASAADIYRVFKDSDGLDRLRLSEQALDPSYLRLEVSKGLVPFEWELLHASQDRSTWEHDEPLDPRRYLVVVDVQHDFVDGSLGTPEAREALPRMVEKVLGFEGTVLFTKDTHTDRYLQSLEGRNLPVEHCIAGSWGWEFAHEELVSFQAAHDGAVYLKGAFGSPDLSRDLEMANAWKPIESIEFIGLCTDICVVSNALLVKAKLPQVPIAVDASCCAGVTPQAHEAALATLASCQVQVL